MVRKIKIKDFSKPSVRSPAGMYSEEFCQELIKEYKLEIDSKSLQDLLEDAQLWYVSASSFTNESTRKETRNLYGRIEERAGELLKLLKSLHVDHEAALTKYEFKFDELAPLKKTLNKLEDAAKRVFTELPLDSAGRRLNKPLVLAASRLQQILEKYSVEGTKRRTRFVFAFLEPLGEFDENLDEEIYMDRLDDILRKNLD